MPVDPSAVGKKLSDPCVNSRASIIWRIRRSPKPQATEMFQD